MSALPKPNSVDPIRTVRSYQPALMMAVITTGFTDFDNFRLLLRRGFAIRFPHYYSIIKQEFRREEAWMRFFCLDHIRRLKAPPQTVAQSENLGSVPEFEIHFGGGKLIMQDCLIEREASFVQGQNETGEITSEVLSWLRQETSVSVVRTQHKDGTPRIKPNEFLLPHSPTFRVDYPPIQKVRDIAFYARALRAQNKLRVDVYLAQKREMDQHIEDALIHSPIPTSPQ